MTDNALNFRNERGRASQTSAVCAWRKKESVKECSASLRGQVEALGIVAPVYADEVKAKPVKRPASGRSESETSEKTGKRLMIGKDEAGLVPASAAERVKSLGDVDTKARALNAAKHGRKGVVTPFYNMGVTVYAKGREI